VTSSGDFTDDFDLTFMDQTDPWFGANIGSQLLRVHPASQCAGRDIPCCIHAPSGHHMATWPMKWRGDKNVMERTCPHGTGHPDPDHMAYVRSLTPEHECSYDYSYKCELGYPHLDWQSVHGCCPERCCSAPAP
jgi:hypothetical protein